MNCHYIREQRHICGPEYMEVDIYPITVREHKASTRAKKKKASDMVRCNLNSENAKRHLRQLVNTNFTWRDLHVTLTYDGEHLPKTEEEAERYFRNWLERVAALPRVGVVTFISSKREWATVLLYTDTRPYRALYRESFALDKLNAVRRPQVFPNNA